jgi:SRSO17 transposase
VTLSWREGSRGAERAKFRALRCWRVDADATMHIGWLIGQRPARAQHGDAKWKYFWSNFGPDVALDRLVEYAHRRHWIEQFYEEAKGLLGWDQFQGRRYDAFQRHTVAVMLSYSFLVWLEYYARVTTRRRGRRRRAFSPSARSATAQPAARASGRRRLALASSPADGDPPATAAPQLSTSTLTEQY